MKNNKGFTLVELLAVIVILAIIMIIAIPAVLQVMQTARRKSFIEYAMKVTGEAQKVYLTDQMTYNTGSCVLYNIKTDLGLNNTGDYDGYVVVKNTNDKQKIYITLHDNEYMIYGVEQNSLDEAEVQKYNSNENLSKNNILSIADCATYTIKTTTTTYETKTETLNPNPQSSTPEVKKLFNGEKEGEGNWVGVYENGNIVGCYNKAGNVDTNYQFFNNGSLETSYCVGQGYYSSDETECIAHKTTTCCTASTEDIGMDYTKIYAFHFTNNNNPSGSKKSCGLAWINSDGVLYGMSIGQNRGGGLPETGLYEE